MECIVPGVAQASLSAGSAYKRRCKAFSHCISLLSQTKMTLKLSNGWATVIADTQIIALQTPEKLQAETETVPEMLIAFAR
jgi:hypothetical protein